MPPTFLRSEKPVVAALATRNTEKLDFGSKSDKTEKRRKRKNTGGNLTLSRNAVNEAPPHF